MFKKSVLATLVAATLTLSGTAMAATDWSGAYVGGALNVSSLDTQFHDYQDEFDNQGLNGSSSITINPGLYAGWNFQDDDFVYGVELDYGLYHAASDSPDVYYSTQTYMKNELKNMVALKGRLGLASGSTLSYVTGGIAMAHADLTIQDYSNMATNTQRLTGLTFGAGIEHQFNSSLVARFQGEYTSFETSKRMDPGSGYEFGATTSLIDFTVGVAYKF